jgi:plasmid segregation protein ParM
MSEMIPLRRSIKYELNIPNTIARVKEDLPVIGIEELDDKNPLDGIHVKYSLKGSRAAGISYQWTKVL